MSNSAEAIARMVEHFRQGRVEPLEWDESLGAQEADPKKTNKVIAGILDEQRIPLVDITAVYRSFTEPWAVYEESVCRPPFVEAVWFMENKHGNMVMCHQIAMDREVPEFQEALGMEGPGDPWPERMQWESMADTHTIEWGRVRWVIPMLFWMGGYSSIKQQYVPTTGPLFQLHFAVYEDGTLGDVHWAELFDMGERGRWDNAIVAVLRAMTMLNCRNVEVLEPRRPKAERKRLQRFGVRVSEIHVMPVGKYARQRGPKRYGEGVPLGVVRGHVARYGPKFDRGLLFGKYEGEYWITPHLRGTAELGEVEHNYTVES